MLTLLTFSDRACPDAGVQPVHLFHLLMATSDQPLPTANLTGEAIAQIEIGHGCVAAHAARAHHGDLSRTDDRRRPRREVPSRATRRALDRSQCAPAPSRAQGPETSQLGAEIRSPTGEAAPCGGTRRMSAVVFAQSRCCSMGLRAVRARIWTTSRCSRERSGPRADGDDALAGGAGNERVYPGRDGWLFYRPDVDYLTARGFLDPADARRRAAPAGRRSIHRRPIRVRRIFAASTAISTRVVSRSSSCRHRSSQAVTQKRCPARYGSSSGALHNPSFREFVDELRRDGVLVFDVSEKLAADRRLRVSPVPGDRHALAARSDGGRLLERLSAFIGRGPAPLSPCRPGLQH